MLTYFLLNVLFMATVLLFARRFVPAHNRAWWSTLGALVIMTAIFDNVIIALGIVGYNSSALLGVYIVKAPVEDFFYSLLAVYLVPALWNYFGSPANTKEEHS